MAMSAWAAMAAAAAALAVAGPVGFAASVLSLALTALGMPIYRAYAMARPNARSSHRTPIPQGGGASVIAATLIVAACALAIHGGGSNAVERFVWLAAGTVLVAAAGAIDDIRPVPALPRLIAQMLAVGLVIHGASGGGQILPLPWWLEAALLVLAGAWFVNLTNFMDGIDGITLAGFMPLAAGIVALGWTGHASPGSATLAMAFLGGLAGFVFFNVPRARLFLGDVGSLPIGLIAGALLLDVAQHGAFAAAIILPLYHFTDATLTLVRRAMRRERVWEAHRQHAYQQAVDRGWPHAAVSGAILALNSALAVLAGLSAGWGVAGQAAAVLLAGVSVIGLIVVLRNRAGRP